MAGNFKNLLAVLASDQKSLFKALLIYSIYNYKLAYLTKIKSVIRLKT